VACFICRRCVDGQLFREVVTIKEIMISSLHKLECAGKFCYLGDLWELFGSVLGYASETWAMKAEYMA